MTKADEFYSKFQGVSLEATVPSSRYLGKIIYADFRNPWILTFSLLLDLGGIAFQWLRTSVTLPAACLYEDTATLF